MNSAIHGLLSLTDEQQHQRVVPSLIGKVRVRMASILPAHFGLLNDGIVPT